MAKFIALTTFRGIKEDTIFEPGDEFEMTVKRSEEIIKNIKAKHPKIGLVMKRIEESEKEDTPENKDTEESK